MITLDQFRADYLTRFDAHFGDTGFKRLLREGASMTGHYGQYATYTGPGHAQILSGSYPYVNGISTNKFYNAATSRSEAMVFDAQSKVLGMKETDPDMDVSPRNFYGSTVGDELDPRERRQIQGDLARDEGPRRDPHGRSARQDVLDERRHGRDDDVDVLHAAAPRMGERVEREEARGHVVREGLGSRAARRGVRDLGARRHAERGRREGSREDVSPQDHGQAEGPGARLLRGALRDAVRERLGDRLREGRHRQRAARAARRHGPARRSRSPRPTSRATTSAR